MEIREKVLEVLQEQRPDIDFETENALVSGGVLESFDILSIIAELDDLFDIEIKPKELVAENFDSLDAIVEVVERLTEE